MLFRALAMCSQVLIEQTLAGEQRTQIIVCLSTEHVNWRVVESTGQVAREKPITPCTCVDGLGLWNPSLRQNIRDWSVLLIFLPPQLMGLLIDNCLSPCVGRIDNRDPNVQVSFELS